MKVFVAMPVYDGKIPVETVTAMLNEQTIALGLGDDIQYAFLPACSHPAMGRNQLAEQFLASECEKLFFLDSDITFELGSILKLAHMPVDFVGGAFRYKMQAECYPVQFLLGERWTDKLGLMEVETLPGGFMCISRKVFDVHREKFPERTYDHHGRTAHCYFQMPYRTSPSGHGHLAGEDSLFCVEWREAGGKVYLDPELELTHWDFKPTPFKGHIGNWLKSQIPQEGKCTK